MGDVLNREQLEALSVAFGVLGRLFCEEPEGGMADGLSSARDLLLDEPFCSAAPEASRGLHGVLAAYAADRALMDSFRQDRAFLFYQVSVSRTSPYESVYRTDDHTLFGPTTAQVKADFERHGLTLASGRNEPCDHFGLECAYLARVAAAGAASDDAPEAATASEEALAGATAELRRFLGEHVLVFAPVYLANVGAQAHSELYRTAAALAQDVLAWAAALLGATPMETLDPADFPLKARG